MRERAHNPSDQDTDADLQAAQAGDIAALERALERAGLEVRRKLSIQDKWRPHLEADDVMQVTYMEAFTRFDRFVGNSFSAFVTWLRHIARNNLIDAIRELERQKRPQPQHRITTPLNSDDSYTSLCAVLGFTTTTPSRAVAAKELRSTVDQALARMPAHYADAIRLFDLQGRTGEEAARELGLSRSAAFMLRARARDHLRELLGPASQFLSDYR